MFLRRSRVYLAKRFENVRTANTVALHHVSDHGFQLPRRVESPQVQDQLHDLIAPQRGLDSLWSVSGILCFQ
jgi:hypothetical protein